MKYEVGQKVKIKSLDWYNENKDELGVVLIENGNYMFCKSDTEWCGKIVTIKEVCLDEYYTIVEDFGKYRWTDEMIEGIVEEPILSAPKITEGLFLKEKDMKWTTEYILPEGYIFKDENGNVINATKIVLEKKKKEYPKTYEECCEVVKVGKEHTLEGATIRINYKIALLESFQKLLICRDAYWKIAGEERRFWKPWKPSDSNVCYGIFTVEEEIRHDFTAKWCILTFPTEEMRDAFYENFKELIEQCKEFL